MPVISTTKEETSIAFNQQISPSGRNDRSGVTVISKEERQRNLFVGKDLSSSYFRFRSVKSPLSKGVAKPGDLLLANCSQKGNWKEISNYKNFAIVIFFLLISFVGFTQNAKRVISLAPSITENLYLMGAQNKLVGCTSFCTLAVAGGKQQVGSTVDVNIEKIMMLKPDLVLAMLLTKQQDIETMKRLGMKVEVIPTPKNFEEICSQTIEIAKLVGYESAAKVIVRKSKQTVDSLMQKSVQRSGKPKIFFQLGANPIFTVLENTFMNDFILLSNSENIANGLTKGSVTRESVLMKNPDVIIVATMGGFGAEEQKIWQSYAGLKAAKNNKIFLIDSETACSPTPVNFAKAFSDVVKFVNQ